MERARHAQNMHTRRAPLRMFYTGDNTLDIFCDVTFSPTFDRVANRYELLGAFANTTAETCLSRHYRFPALSYIKCCLFMAAGKLWSETYHIRFGKCLQIQRLRLSAIGIVQCTHMQSIHNVSVIWSNVGRLFVGCLVCLLWRFDFRFYSTQAYSYIDRFRSVYAQHTVHMFCNLIRWLRLCVFMRVWDHIRSLLPGVLDNDDLTVFADARKCADVSNTIGTRGYTPRYIHPIRLILRTTVGARLYPYLRMNVHMDLPPNCMCEPLEECVLRHVWNTHKHLLRQDRIETSTFSENTSVFCRSEAREQTVSGSVEKKNYTHREKMISSKENTMRDEKCNIHKSVSWTKWMWMECVECWICGRIFMLHIFNEFAKKTNDMHSNWNI